MKKKIMSLVLAASLAFGGVSFVSVRAATDYVSCMACDVVVKAGDAKFVSEMKHQEGDFWFDLVQTKDGKKKVLVSDVVCGFATDGSTLFYAKRTKQMDELTSKNTIYQADIESGKKSKIVTGTNYMVCGSNGSYLYCGNDNGPDGINLYAVNLKTKKKKHMVDVVGDLFVTEKRVITTMRHGDVDNYPVYSFAADGSDKVKIADASFVSVKGSTIYYVKYRQNGQQRLFSCSLKGKNKKTLTKWGDPIPERYYK